MRKYSLEVKWDIAPESENIEITPSLLAQSMFFYVQAIGRFVANRRYYTARDQYNSFLMLWTKEGCGKLQYRGKEYVLSPGTVCLLDCKEPHEYRTEGKRQWEMYWIHFNGASSQSYVDLILRNASPVLRLSADSDIPEWIAKLLGAHRSRQLYTDIISSKWITDILTELMIQSIHRESGVHSVSCPQYILEIMNQMERNCGMSITLDELAAQHNFSKYHLAREFKRYTGYSPNEYLTHVRLSVAKEMLKYSPLSISQISEQSGFNQPSYFIRSFKQKEGVTPLAYRKSWRGESEIR